MDKIDEFVGVLLKIVPFFPLSWFIQLERLPLQKIPNYVSKRKLFFVQETVF